MNRLRVAVVGVGALGRHHARILSELDGVELVAVADSQAERGQEVANKHQTRWVADYRDLLEKFGRRGFGCCSDRRLDPAVAGAFLERGIPVLVEKPLAGTSSTARNSSNWPSARRACCRWGTSNDSIPLSSGGKKHRRPEVHAVRTNQHLHVPIDRYRRRTGSDDPRYRPGAVAGQESVRSIAKRLESA